MKYISIIYRLINIAPLFAQKVIYKEIPVKGDILLTEGIAIPKVKD